MDDLKYIYKYLLKFPKELITTIILVVVETVFELIIPFLMKDIIDEGITNGDMNQILISGALIIGCAIVSLITGHFYSRFNARLITNFSYSLREDAFTKIQTYSFANLDHFKTESLVTRVTNDVTILQNTCGTIRPICRAPLMMLMGVGLSFAMAPKIAWIFIVFIPFLAVILFFIVKKTAKQYSVLQENIDGLNQIVRENVTAIRTVKAYVREEHEEMKFNEANTKVVKTTKHTFHIAQLNQPSFQFVLYGITVLILAFGSRLVHNNELKVGSLSALLSYILQVVNSLMMISNVFLMINRGFASCKRLREVLEEEPDIKSSDKSYKVLDGSIDFNHVYFKYNKAASEYVLEDIELHIKKGETIGILGGTGSAKSTLISLIARLYDVTEGSLCIDNKDVRDYDLVNLRDSIAVVLQNNVLFSGSVRDNLRYGDDNASDEEMLEACRIACADEFITQLPSGLDYDLGQGGVNLSGGQKQRLCIARALLKKPKVLILDDSTSACDMETERKIVSGIRKLEGVTSIIIAQRISSVDKANRIIILDDGKINDIGTHDELLTHNKIYQDLYKAQVGGKQNG